MVRLTFYVVFISLLLFVSFLLRIHLWIFERWNSRDAIEEVLPAWLSLLFLSFPEELEKAVRYK